MKELKRVSRWISVQWLEVTDKHSLWDYGLGWGDGYNMGSTRVVEAFRWHNRWYAVDQFVGRYGIFGFDPECNKYPAYITGYDGAGDLYHPLLMETDRWGEKVRLYQEK